MKEFDALIRLFNHMKKHGADFLIISQSLFSQATDLFLSKAGSAGKNHSAQARSCQLTEKDEVYMLPFHLSEGKEEITGKIRDLLDLQLILDSGNDPFRDLTQREKTIVRLVSMGLTNQQIAG